MHFLKTLFWVVIAVIAVVFSVNNWRPVQVSLWGGMVADVKLPILLFAAFLLGFLPWFTLHRATRWHLRRRLETSERALAEARGLPVDEPSPSPTGTSSVVMPPAS